VITYIPKTGQEVLVVMDQGDPAPGVVTWASEPWWPDPREESVTLDIKLGEGLETSDGLSFIIIEGHRHWEDALWQWSYENVMGDYVSVTLKELSRD
jgi:hypothetical protein